MHTIVLFDAVGTVIQPSPSVIDVYFELGQKYGSRLERSQVKKRISEARSKHFHVGTCADGELPPLISNDELEYAMWKRLVLDVFSELDTCDILFDELWEHFALPKNWQTYNDVESCWAKLRSHDIKICLASNFDSRLLGICEALDPFRDADSIFCSSEIGYRKPSPMFYQTIEDRLTGLYQSPLNLVMIGDDFENDYAAPKLAGWESVWLNRQQARPARHDATNVEEVRSLNEFADRIILNQSAC